MFRQKSTLIILLLVLCFFLTLLLTFYNLQHIRDSPVDINTCTKEALIDRPEIGEVLETRIMQERPYKDIYELDRVKGIGPQTIKSIKNRVVAK